MLWKKHATNDTDITKHLNQFTYTHNLLALQEKPTSDSNFKNAMLETMPTSWNSFTSSLLAQTTTPALTITQMHLILSAEYHHLKRQNQVDNTAYTASSPHTKKEKGICSICKWHNHITQDCCWVGKDAPKCNSWKAFEADFSTYSWIIDSGVTMHIFDHCHKWCGHLHYQFAQQRLGSVWPQAHTVPLLGVEYIVHHLFTFLNKTVPCPCAMMGLFPSPLIIFWGADRYITNALRLANVPMQLER